MSLGQHAKENIERAIAKGTGGGEGARFEDLTYEAFGPLEWRC